MKSDKNGSQWASDNQRKIHISIPGNWDKSLGGRAFCHLCWATRTVLEKRQKLYYELLELK